MCQPVAAGLPTPIEGETMTMITQEKLDTIWDKYAERFDNDANPDVIRMDYQEEVANLGGIEIAGRGHPDWHEAKALVDTLKERGWAVLDDPAREGQEDALVLFLPLGQQMAN
jgi:hypothetical protein